MRTGYFFDLDGTVTATEFLPCIASEIGVSDEIATLTGATLAGHIAFEPSFRLRCLILGQVPLERVHRTAAEIPLDKAILSFIRAHAEDCFLITENLDVWVQPIVDRCGCRVYSSTSFIEGGLPRVGSILNKTAAIAEMRALGYERIVAAGDGADDVPMLAAADISVAFGGVHAPAAAAISAADYVIHEGAALCRLLQAL